MSNIEDVFALHGAVEELHIDEEFATHMAEELRRHDKHSVAPKEIRQVHARTPRYFENKGEGRTAPIIMVGPTDSGRMIAVPIEPTHTIGVWRPVTAFEANAHHRDRYYEEKAQ